MMGFIEIAAFPYVRPPFAGSLQEMFEQLQTIIARAVRYSDGNLLEDQI